jgi:galactokinase
MKISTAGRICFFGEHQDYLGLPVIAAAISRRIAINGSKRTDNLIVIDMPDIGHTEQISLTDVFPYKKERDYFRSIIHVLKKRGFAFSVGFDCEIQGNIPINSGTSSSSALNVSWANFLVRMADNPAELSTKTLGEIAYEAEVLEFGEPGGMMDQYSTAIGNVIYLESVPEIRVEALQPNLGTFVLGDSQQPKDTLGILARCRYGMEAIIEKVKQFDPTFSIFTTSAEKSPEYKAILTADEWGLFNANVSDRDILRAGKIILSQKNVDNQAFGQLLYAHHQNLRDYKKTSTTKIDRMIEAALTAGALGAKINGSGGGGCMYAYAPTNAKAVAEAIEREGGKAYIINVDGGTREII